MSDDSAEIEAAAAALLRARYPIALTGAGLSVESGIPPFRGPGGLWTKHGEPPMNGYQRFLADPRKAWEERLNPSGPMRELWSALNAAEPNPGHRALVELEDMGVVQATIMQSARSASSLQADSTSAGIGSPNDTVSLLSNPLQRGQLGGRMA